MAGIESMTAEQRKVATAAGLRSTGRPADVERIDAALALVRAELIEATTRFGSFASAHEGYAVILEEVDELWDEVKTNRPDLAAKEAVQVAAMGARWLLDVDPHAAYLAHLDGCDQCNYDKDCMVCEVGDEDEPSAAHACNCHHAHGGRGGKGRNLERLAR